MENMARLVGRSQPFWEPGSNVGRRYFGGLCSNGGLCRCSNSGITSLFSETLKEKSTILLELCRASFKQIVTAESCTGGLVSACLTEIPGASDVFQRGFVTYSNNAKIKELSVSKNLIDTVGAVSEEVVCAMAHGALACTPADLSLAITGVAGPGGGTKAKPVGLVHFAVAGRNTKTCHQKLIIPGDRSMVRMVSVGVGIDMLLGSARRLLM